MIYITGDIHARPEKRFSTDMFPQGKYLTKEDYVIVLGDFGLIWDYKGENANEKYWLKWLDEKPWTTLFIDGNHENFDRLNAYPYEEWHGGLVHKIRPSVIHLMRGEVYDICGKRFLALGGAKSHDIEHGIVDPADYENRNELRAACRSLEEKHGGWQFAMYRIKGESWWEQEVPNAADRHNAIYNLSFVYNKVDYVLSHDAPASDVILLGQGYYEPDEYSYWLEQLRSSIVYDKWFFGHYHQNKMINTKEMCLYDKIERIV